MKLVGNLWYLVTNLEVVGVMDFSNRDLLDRALTWIGAIFKYNKEKRSDSTALIFTLAGLDFFCKFSICHYF